MLTDLNDSTQHFGGNGIETQLTVEKLKNLIIQEKYWMHLIFILSCPQNEVIL